MAEYLSTVSKIASQPYCFLAFFRGAALDTGSVIARLTPWTPGAQHLCSQDISSNPPECLAFPGYQSALGKLSLIFLFAHGAGLHSQAVDLPSESRFFPVSELEYFFQGLLMTAFLHKWMPAPYQSGLLHGTYGWYFPADRAKISSRA